MKCPKCHYLSFEPEPRCRNCGYDLAVHDDEPQSDPDPVIKGRDAEGPLADFDLRRTPPVEKPSATLGPMRPREFESRPAGSYRPPVRQPSPVEPKAPRNVSAAAVVDPPASQRSQPVGMRPEAPRPAPVRPEPVRPSRPELSKIDSPKSPDPKIPDSPKRPPQTTTSDLPLFMKRLPDAEPAVEAPVESPLERDLKRTDEVPPSTDTPDIVKAVIDRPIERAVEPAIERPADKQSEKAIEKPIDVPIERPVQAAPKPGPLAAEIDRPLIKLPPAPRPPLSVRRNAEQPRTGREPDSTRTDERDLLDDLVVEGERATPPSRGSIRADFRSLREAPDDGAAPAGPFGRTIAAVLDSLFLAGVGAGVLWVTLRVCGLTMTDLPVLPALVALPLAAFVLLIYLGYLLLFTAAGGQTLGKMAARIRVVGTSPDTGHDERLNIQRAVVRSLVTLPSVLALGAGFVPALFGDRLAVHDRIAQTRVVRV